MRASGASELEHFHNHIHLPMQLLRIYKIIITSDIPQKKGALFFKKK